MESTSDPPLHWFIPGGIYVNSGAVQLVVIMWTKSNTHRRMVCLRNLLKIKRMSLSFFRALVQTSETQELYDQGDEGDANERPSQKHIHRPQTDTFIDKKTIWWLYIRFLGIEPKCSQYFLNYSEDLKNIEFPFSVQVKFQLLCEGESIFIT